jgi:hypothetical protein
MAGAPCPASHVTANDNTPDGHRGRSRTGRAGPERASALENTGRVALHLILMQAPAWTYRLSGRQDVSANTHLIPGGNHKEAACSLSDSAPHPSPEKTGLYGEPAHLE